mgnify:CR=1 FL=1
MKEFLYISLLIMGFIVVLLAAYYFTKFIGSKMSYSNTNKHIKVLDRVFLGNDKSICIIQIGNRFFVIGITNHHIELISELNEAEVVPISDDNSGSFSNIFETYMNKLVNRDKDKGQGMNRIQQALYSSLKKQNTKTNL